MKQYTLVLTNKNGVEGYEVRSNEKGNSNSIFFPVSGTKQGTRIVDAGIAGTWSSSLALNNPNAAELLLGHDPVLPFLGLARWQGFTVRPVIEIEK